MNIKKYINEYNNFKLDKQNILKYIKISLKWMKFAKGRLKENYHHPMLDNVITDILVFEELKKYLEE